MKPYMCLVFVCIPMIANIAFAQQTDNSITNDSTSLPGDNFNLQGALEMFKNAKSPEDFEQKLNTESNYVNNLDLDDDGKTDYIQVIDKTDNDIRAIVLQVAVSETELQDVAVIEIEKNGNESAMLQIIGDEELYGDSVIVEPVAADDGKTGGGRPVSVMAQNVIVNVWLWPCVKFIYAPAYVVWISPWKWHKYPVWWKPWNPKPWRAHHILCAPYYVGFHPVYIHRVVAAHKFYKPYRKTSVIVVNRFKPVHQQYKKNNPGHIHKQYPDKQINKSGNKNTVQKNKAPNPNNHGGKQSKGGGFQKRNGKK